MHGEMSCSGDCRACQNSLVLLSRFQPLHLQATPKGLSAQHQTEPASDRQTLATLRAARVDHSAATPGLHADQKTMGTGTTDFGRLVSAFHLEILGGSVWVSFYGPDYHKDEEAIVISP
jgi:hypothetical protein